VADHEGTLRERHLGHRRARAITPLRTIPSSCAAFVPAPSRACPPFPPRRSMVWSRLWSFQISKPRRRSRAKGVELSSKGGRVLDDRVFRERAGSGREGAAKRSRRRYRRSQTSRSCSAHDLTVHVPLETWTYCRLWTGLRANRCPAIRRAPARSFSGLSRDPSSTRGRHRPDDCPGVSTYVSPGPTTVGLHVFCVILRWFRDQTLLQSGHGAVGMEPFVELAAREGDHRAAGPRPEASSYGRRAWRNPATSVAVGAQSCWRRLTPSTWAGSGFESARGLSFIAANQRITDDWLDSQMGGMRIG